MLNGAGRFRDREQEALLEAQKVKLCKLNPEARSGLVLFAVYITPR